MRSLQQYKSRPQQRRLPNLRLRIGHFLLPKILDKKPDNKSVQLAIHRQQERVPLQPKHRQRAPGDLALLQRLKVPGGHRQQPSPVLNHKEETPHEGLS